MFKAFVRQREGGGNWTQASAEGESLCKHWYVSPDAKTVFKIWKIACASEIVGTLKLSIFSLLRQHKPLYTLAVYSFILSRHLSWIMLCNEETFHFINSRLCRHSFRIKILSYWNKMCFPSSTPPSPSLPPLLSEPMPSFSH